MSLQPMAVAAWLKRPWMRFEMRGQKIFSLVRGMLRLRMMPHSCRSVFGKAQALEGNRDQQQDSRVR